MTKLYFNGCSFTYGSGLDNPADACWAALVAKHYNAEYKNDAVPGGSNDRIVKGVVTNIKNYDKFYVCWTYYSRFVKYNPVDNFEVLFTVGSVTGTKNSHNDKTKNNYTKYQEFVDIYYKHWFNELYEFKGFLHQIILLQSLFQVHRKDYVMLNTSYIWPWLSPIDSFAENIKHMICFDKMSDEQIYREHKEINELVNQIDLTKFVFWNYDIVSFMRECNFFISKNDGHPNTDGHKAIAEKILAHDSN